MNNEAKQTMVKALELLRKEVDTAVMMVKSGSFPDELIGEQTDRIATVAEEIDHAVGKSLAASTLLMRIGERAKPLSASRPMPQGTRE